jgi:AcrR family transcriptional regulator
VPSNRRVPTQKRSLERVERILRAARTLIERHGSESLRMSEVAEQSGMSMGALYQYFPDRAAIIARLAEEYNAMGRTCTATALASVHTPADLAPALQRITDEFYALYLEHPVMRDLWAATQADRALQVIDAEDSAVHTAMLESTLTGLHPDRSPSERFHFALLVMQLLAATVRLAITLDRSQAEALLITFKRLVLNQALTTLAFPSDDA